jgi:hypothetical protein
MPHPAFTWVTVSSNSTGLPVLSLRIGLPKSSSMVPLTTQGLVVGLHSAGLQAGFRLRALTTAPTATLPAVRIAGAPECIQPRDGLEGDEDAASATYRHVLAWATAARGGGGWGEGEAAPASCTMVLLTDALRSTADGSAPPVGRASSLLLFTTALCEGAAGSAGWWGVVENPNAKAARVQLNRVSPAIVAALTHWPRLATEADATPVRLVPPPSSLASFLHAAATSAGATHAAIVCGGCIGAASADWGCIAPSSAAALLHVVATTSATLAAILCFHVLLAARDEGHKRLAVDVAAVPLALVRDAAGVSLAVGAVDSPLRVLLLRPSRMVAVAAPADGRQYGGEWSGVEAAASVAGAVSTLGAAGLARALVAGLGAVEAGARAASTPADLACYWPPSALPECAESWPFVLRSIVSASAATSAHGVGDTALFGDATEGARDGRRRRRAGKGGTTTTGALTGAAEAVASAHVKVVGRFDAAAAALSREREAHSKRAQARPTGKARREG